MPAKNGGVFLQIFRLNVDVSEPKHHLANTFHISLVFRVLTLKDWLGLGNRATSLSYVTTQRNNATMRRNHGTEQRD